jgi:hypothetical protein
MEQHSTASTEFEETITPYIEKLKTLRKHACPHSVVYVVLGDAIEHIQAYAAAVKEIEELAGPSWEDPVKDPEDLLRLELLCRETEILNQVIEDDEAVVRAFFNVSRRGTVYA